jgi:hypothetical protein
MDNNRNIKIRVWNVRGINSQEKWDAIRAKFQRVLVIFYAFKKPRENILIAFIWRGSALDFWTKFSFLPPLVLLEALLLFRIVAYFLLLWFRLITLL